MTSTVTRAGRAAPLPLPERRAAIIAAALPLLAVHGQDTTTRQIAEAAGIAEGTVFRAFVDKSALIDAAVDAAFDTAPTIAAISAIDESLPLRDKLIEAIDILRVRLAEVWSLMAALRLFGPAMRPAAHPSAHHDESERMDQALTGLLRPCGAQLRTEPAFAARALRLLVFSGTHPRITNGEPMASTDIADLLLHGIHRPDPADPPTTPRRTPC